MAALYKLTNDRRDKYFWLREGQVTQQRDKHREDCVTNRKQKDWEIHAGPRPKESMKRRKRPQSSTSANLLERNEETKK